MKLIALDVDGTLLNSDHKINPKTRNSLIKALEEGNKVVIVSGRPTEAIRGLAAELEFDKHGGLISAFNGGSISNYQTGEKITNHTIDLDLAKEILRETKDLDLEIIIPNEGKIISDREEKYLAVERDLLGLEAIVDKNIRDAIDFPPNKLLFANDPEVLDKLIPILEEKYGDKTSLIRTQRFYYEIMPQNLSKGKSLLEITDYYGIDQKDIIAFGDELNDETMLEVAGVGVAMANAVDHIKEIADYITLSNDEDGIADYLETFVLKGDSNE